jgi:hypothetical protein
MTTGAVFTTLHFLSSLHTHDLRIKRSCALPTVLPPLPSKMDLKGILITCSSLLLGGAEKSLLSPASFRMFDDFRRGRSSGRLFSGKVKDRVASSRSGTSAAAAIEVSSAGSAGVGGCQIGISVTPWSA